MLDFFNFPIYNSFWKKADFGLQKGTPFCKKIYPYLMFFCPSYRFAQQRKPERGILRNLGAAAPAFFPFFSASSNPEGRKARKKHPKGCFFLILFFPSPRHPGKSCSGRYTKARRGSDTAAHTRRCGGPPLCSPMERLPKRKTGWPPCSP